MSRPGLGIALYVEGWPVLVVGSGPVAEDRVARLTEAGAAVTALPAGGFAPGAARGVRLVVCCDPGSVDVLEAAARAEGALFYAHDQPGRSDLAFPARIRRGPLEVTVATQGTAPALSARLRAGLEGLLDERLTRFAEEVAAARRQGGPDAARAAAARLRLTGTVEIDEG